MPLPTYIIERKQIYYFRIAVPKSQIPKFGKRQIWQSLRTTDKKTAVKNAAPLISKYAAIFADQPAFDQDLAKQVLAISHAYGFTYRQDSEIAKATNEEAVLQIGPALRALEKNLQPSEVEVDAFGGAVKPAALTMMDALQRYKLYCEDKFMEYSDERERDKRWRPFQQAAKAFTEVLKDVDIFSLKPIDCIKFRTALIAQVKEGKLKPETAQKKIMWLRLIHTKILEIERPELLPSPWDRLSRINGNAGEKGKRPSFSEEEITKVRTMLLDSDASKQVIALNLISMNTGATCKELTHLHKDDIFLDAPIPYISIRPNANRSRVKKNGSRIRDIPLVGHALTEMKKFPNGFSEFCKNNGSEELSRISNELIKGAAKDRTFYSYRHTIADRLRRSGCQDTLKNSIMGHASKGMEMHYGEGYTLENKLEALKKALPEGS
ncbi:DUF6538 domain-containing protein [Neorhizobium alkalisoli]|uniref:Phage integrase family protein n=1 Tax=Neorhizobium alkalisoli TaxID=528178 RepID=A0A561Q7K8_9HYPH|nr:DUF6538 domain-containing protein [Neorhizobium alkalisoli]TWF46335.1 phage integrase family protein [Neorhizobium alkalisoli]